MEGMEGKTKLAGFKEDGCHVQNSMSMKPLQKVRDVFRTRTCMVEGVKGNFKGRHAENDLKCEGCVSMSDIH